MEINRKQQNQPGKEQQEAALTPEGEMNDISPDIPVVRTNTPRPLSFASMLSHAGQEQADQLDMPFHLPRFPSMAPSAPPLPEELGEGDEEGGEEVISPVALSDSVKTASTNAGRDFVWLFEYGLEMDPTLLNSSERLDGLALLYGSVVLRGYTLMLGTVARENKQGNSTQTIATIVPDTTPGAEVWGVLYRVPRRLAEHVAGEPSTLETIHFIGVAPALFGELQVVVNDPYRKRDIACVAYAVTEYERKQITFVPVEQARDTLFVQQLMELARKQKLPDRYLGMYPSHQPVQANGNYTTTTIANPPQDTEPLPVMKEANRTASLAQALPETPLVTALPQSSAAPATSVPTRLLMVFAIYLIITLLGVLSFAVIQGLGFAHTVLNANFAPLGVPWLVMLYGLLGGCISCIAMLGRYRTLQQPHYVIISWFTRPYIGAVLAALAYLALNSGIFAIKAGDDQHLAASLLFGAIAGLCEGWIFFRWK